MDSNFREQFRLRLRGLNDEREASRAGAALGRLRVGYRANRTRSKPKRWTGFMADGSNDLVEGIGKEPEQISFLQCCCWRLYSTCTLR